MGARRRYRVAAVSIALACAVPANAGAATEIGATVRPDLLCGGDRMSFSVFSPPGAASYRVSIPGVITSWRHRAATPVRPLQFKVARPLGGNVAMIVGESEMTFPPSPGVHTFPIRIQVLPGDVIGFYWPLEAGCADNGPGYRNVFRVGNVNAGSFAGFAPAEDDVQNDIAATLEPDCDGDGFGDDSQDSDVSGCPPVASRTASLESNKAKVRRKKDVILSGRVDAGGDSACVANQSIDLQRLEDGTFETFAQVETDGQGAFTSSVEVRKTYEYRVQVPDAIGCASAVSSAVKVKAKKRKKKKKN